MPNNDKQYKHDFSVINAIPGTPLPKINKALNAGADVDTQIMFNALGECIIVCHIKSENLKGNFPLPKVVELEGQSS